MKQTQQTNKTLRREQIVKEKECLIVWLVWCWSRFYANYSMFAKWQGNLQEEVESSLTHEVKQDSRKELAVGKKEHCPGQLENTYQFK